MAPPQSADPLPDLETIPEAERQRIGSHLELLKRPESVSVSAADLVDVPTVDRSIQPVAIDVVGDAKESLIVFRQKVDEQVRQKHIAVARAHHREAAMWAGSIVLMYCLPAGGGVISLAAALVVYVAVLKQQRFVSWPLCVGVIAAVAIAGWNTALTLELGLLAGAATAPLLYAWLIAPLPDPATAGDVEATGATNHQRVHTSVDQLKDMHVHQTSVDSINQRIVGLVRRLTVVRSGVAGAYIALIGLYLAGMNAPFGEFTARGVVLQMTVGAVIGGWIGQTRPGVLWSMMVYGLANVMTYAGLFVAGMLAFNIFLAMWILCAWVVAGGFLGQMVAFEEDLAPQRTS
ncbi:MAG: hypothetical protein AAB263_13940 [Planctomycetota bacterium]